MAHAVRLTEKVSSVTEEEELRQRGYSLGPTLGEGSYAKVKSAFSENISKRVAIKIINKKKAPRDFQHKFLPRELDILQKISHPYISQLYELMNFGGKVYIVMEIAGHGDLLEYIKLRGAIPEERSKMLFLQLLEAVEYLHLLNIVHRDLKCENILLDSNNNVKLTDFGFSRVLKPGEVSKTFCGSAAYAAPEILQGQPYVGTSYDVWSMGVILYIMVCGSMPYDDSNIKKMIRYQTERKVGFSSRAKNVSSVCKDMIHRILEANIPTRASLTELRHHPWLESVIHTSLLTAPKPELPMRKVDSATQTSPMMWRDEGKSSLKPDGDRLVKAQKSRSTKPDTHQKKVKTAEPSSASNAIPTGEG